MEFNFGDMEADLKLILGVTATLSRHLADKLLHGDLVSMRVCRCIKFRLLSSINLGKIEGFTKKVGLLIPTFRDALHISLQYCL